MKKEKFPYETPKITAVCLLDDVLTFSIVESDQEDTPETENDDWGMGNIPF